MTYPYLRKHWITILLYCGVSFIFTIIMLLNDLSWDVILYSISLSAIFGVMVLVYDYLNYFEKQRILSTQLTRIRLTVEGLPVANDTIEYQYQQLIHALHDELKMSSTRADQIQGELITYYTIWAHQIRNPIAAMRLVLQTHPSAEHRELLIELIKIEQYVEMVLQMVRLDSLSTDYHFRLYEIDDIIRPVLRKYASIFITKDLKLHYEPLQMQVVTDDKWLTFVIEQIISNALKYTQEGTISIIVNEHNELVISDTGIGIDPADLPRICEKGFTGFNGRYDQASTGIGLFLVNRILKKLGHALRFESALQRGTSVFISLERRNLQLE